MKHVLLLALAVAIPEWAGCAAATPPARCPEAGAMTHGDYDPARLMAAGVDPAALRCNRDNRWGSTIRPDSKAGAADLLAAVAPHLQAINDSDRAALAKKLEGLLMWRMVRAVLIEGDTNNFGAVALRGRTFVDEKGAERPVLLFRTGFTPRPAEPDSCFQSLLRAGGVKHVVNLFDGDIPAADLVLAESQAAAACGATYHTATDEGSGGYGPWRDTLRKHYDDPARRAEAMQSVARLIKEQILLPGGAPPRGNVHVHCGGGMHRTGMIVGVVERCVNGEAPEVVEAHYRYHVGWKDAAHPGGAEEGNLRFIQDFDCALLGP